MNEQAQAEQLLQDLQRLRRQYSEYKSLWRALGDACETVEERIRVLVVNKRKAELNDLSTAVAIDNDDVPLYQKEVEHEKLKR